MADFKAALSALGYADVRTLLNSGNAVFSTPVCSPPKLAKEIAASVHEKFEVATPVVVKSAYQFESIINRSHVQPLEAGHSRFLVVLGQDLASLDALRPLVSLSHEPEHFVIGTEAAYLYCPGGMLASKVGKAMLGKAGRAVTTRNWVKVLKTGALLSAA
jgi:uncharacterized protein (DUF1697 family)